MCNFIENPAYTQMINSESHFQEKFPIWMFFCGISVTQMNVTGRQEYLFISVVRLLWLLPSSLLTAVSLIWDLSLFCYSLQEATPDEIKSLQYKCDFADTWTLLWKRLLKDNNLKLWPHCLMFWYWLFSAVVAGRVRLNYCGVLHSSLCLSSPSAFWTSVLFVINILLWWVTLPFIYRQLLPDNVFFPLLSKESSPFSPEC